MLSVIMSRECICTGNGHTLTA